MSREKKCAECGRPESAHHEFVEIQIQRPESCKCWEDAAWSVLTLPAVCATYTATGPRERICAVCEHNEECHVTG